MIYLRAGRDLQCAVHCLLIHCNGVHTSARDAQCRLRCAVDHILDVACQLQLQAVFSVELDLPDAVSGWGIVRQKGVCPDAGLLDQAISLHPEGDLLVFDVVHHQLGGVHIAEDHAVLARFTDAAAADHDLPQHLHVLQHHVTQFHPRSDVQISRHNGIFQSNTGGCDRHVAPNISQCSSTRPADRGANGVQEDHRSLPPGDAFLRPEGAVRITADQVILRCRGDHSSAPCTDASSVRKTGVLPHCRFHHQVLRQNESRLLPGDAQVRGKGSRGGPRNISLRIADVYIFRIPCGARNIPEGMSPRRSIAKCPVDDSDKFRPGDGVSRPQIPICIPLKQSQLFHSFHIWLCIVRMDLCRERPYQGAGHGTQQQEDSRRPQIFKTKLFPSLHLCPLLPFSFSFTQIPVVPLSCRLNTASRIIFSSSWTSSSNAAANSGIGSPEGRCRSTFMFSSRG